MVRWPTSDLTTERILFLRLIDFWFTTGVTKRCRLSLLTNSVLVYSCAHGTQINFGDLTPYFNLWFPYTQCLHRRKRASFFGKDEWESYTCEYHYSAQLSGDKWATWGQKVSVFRIRIRIHRIRMFLGLPDLDPDPFVRGMDPDPDPSVIMQK